MSGILEPSFVVTGTGRSGTGFIAELLTAAGVICGHERWFRPLSGFGDPYYHSPEDDSLVRAWRRTREEIARRFRTPTPGKKSFRGVDGDSSWEAVPRLPHFSGKVLLQVREPLAVVSSYVAMRFFSGVIAEDGPRQRFVRAHFDATVDDILDAMRWWSNGTIGLQFTQI